MRKSPRKGQDYITTMLLNEDYLHGFRYNTIKGDMSAVIGDVWTMVEPLTTISWDAPRNVGF